MEWAKWNAPILMVLISFEVVMRYFFNNPTRWGGDVMIMLSAFGRMIGIGYGQLVRAHVIMDVFTANLIFRRAKILDLANHLLFIMPLTVVLIYATLKRTLKSWRVKETMYSPWRPPIYPLNTVLVGCYVILVVQLVSEVIKDIISLQKGSDAWIKRR